MTDDLVKRLREVKDWWREPGRTAEQAADRIETLEKENGRLREMFRAHMLYLMPNLTHEDISNHIEEVVKDD
jgi:hypothetical protein